MFLYLGFAEKFLATVCLGGENSATESVRTGCQATITLGRDAYRQLVTNGTADVAVFVRRLRMHWIYLRFTVMLFTNFLHSDIVCFRYMGNEIRFTLLALVTDRKLTYTRKIESLQKQYESMPSDDLLTEVTSLKNLIEYERAKDLAAKVRAPL